MSKVRKGFVSNSSSSSFVCDITGKSYEGYDGEYEVQYAACVKGHEFCADDYDDVMSYIRENDGDCWDLPEEICPICNGTAKPDIVKRLKSDITRLNISLDDLK